MSDFETLRETNDPHRDATFGNPTDISSQFDQLVKVQIMNQVFAEHGIDPSDERTIAGLDWVQVARFRLEVAERFAALRSNPATASFETFTRELDLDSSI